MENTVATAKPRSLVRRIAAPLILSTAVLSGGGWGVYYFLTGSATEQAGEQAVSSSVAAHGAPSATDELKNLFASDTASKPASSTSRPETIKAEDVPTVKADRYSSSAEVPSIPSTASPQLPPLETVAKRQDSPDTADMLPSDTSPPNIVGDRYAAALSLPSSPPPLEPTPSIERRDESSLDQTEAVDDQFRQETIGQDVARGQEPEVNPLRAAAQSLDTKHEDPGANAVFDETPLPVQAASPPPMAIRTATNPPEEVSAAINGARPLPQENLVDQRPNRFQSAEPTLADPPAVGLDRTGAGAVARQPVPAFGIAQPNPTRQEGSPRVALGAQLSTGPDSITPTPGLTNRPGTGRPGEQLLEGVQSPSITIQKLAPAEIQVGKRCTFAIRIQNTGQRTAQNVQIHDEVPLGTELVGTSPRAAVSGSHVVWDMGTLSVGEERTVEMELLPVEEGELGSVATVTLAAQASAKARCTRPQLALRLSCKPQVLAGQQHVVQIEISNPGSGVATGVMLLENLPPGVSHQSGPALEFEVGTLQPGESRRMELVLTAEQAGRINNIMTARADANLRVEANCEFEIIAPELKLSIEGPQRRYLERPATYRVSIDNPGTATANEVQLVTHLPKGLQFVSANNMGEYDASTHSVKWSLAELPANERGTVELVALPIEPGEQTLQATSKARQGLEDRTEKQVLVEGLAALTFEVTDVEGLIEIGGETTYEIRVANQGSKAADNVQVVAIMPPGLRAISGQGETQHTIQGDRVIFAPLAQLAPKAETSFRIQAQGISPGDQRVRVMVKTNELQQPITEEVSTRVYADE